MGFEELHEQKRVSTAAKTRTSDKIFFIVINPFGFVYFIILRFHSFQDVPTMFRHSNKRLRCRLQNNSSPFFRGKEPLLPPRYRCLLSDLRASRRIYRCYKAQKEFHNGLHQHTALRNPSARRSQHHIADGDIFCFAVCCEARRIPCPFPTDFPPPPELLRQVSGFRQE